MLTKIRRAVSRPKHHLSAPVHDLTWVDEFIAHVRPYIFVRESDCLLIKRPNMAHKLNPVGAKLLKQLLDGHTMAQVLAGIRPTPEQINQIADFLFAVKQQLEGSLEHVFGNPAVQIQPFTLEFSQYPILSEVALTYRCNLRCAFCYAGCNCTANPTGSRDEMTPDQVRAVLHKIFHQAQVPSVSFTGGEPTLVPELPEYIRFAKDLGMRVNLITNGTQITRGFAGKLADNGLDSAQVSLEGVTARVHDQVVGHSGAFEQSVGAVGHLKEAGILTHTNTTITRMNIHQCVLFPEYTRQKLGNDRFSMNLMIPVGSAAMDDKLSVSYRQIGSVLEQIIQESHSKDVTFMWYSPVPMCMFNSISHGLGNKGCSACDGLISVGANADVLPCSSYGEPVGNLLTHDFEKIWHAPVATLLRKKGLAHPECRRCSDFAACHGACPLYWKQHGFGELETILGRTA